MPKGLKEENIAAKKDKILKRPMIIEDFVEIKGSERENLVKDMIDGREVKRKDAKIRQHLQSGKAFLFKRDGAELRFGVDLFRILSNKQYAARRVSNAFEKEDLVSSVKWGELSKEPFCVDPSAEYDFTSCSVYSSLTEDQGDQEFLRGYARMCGVMHVLGEADYNHSNFFINKKTGRPIKIDHSFLINSFSSYFPEDVSPIYGSSQSSDFLRRSLAGKRSDLMAASIARESQLREKEKIDVAVEALESLQLLKTLNSVGGGALGKVSTQGDDLNKALDQSISQYILQIKQHSKDRAEAFVESYNKGLDSDLFDEIKKNIEKNPILKSYLLEFVEGLQDAIELSKDEDFLDRYVEKYSDLDKEIEEFYTFDPKLGYKKDGVGYFEKAKIQRGFFKKNASRAEEQFDDLIKYCAKIRGEEVLSESPSASAEPKSKESLKGEVVKETWV